MSGADEVDVERLAREAPALFGTRTVEVPPACVLTYDAAIWEDAIVFVTAGEIELECSSGECRRFRQGDILCLAPLPMRLVRNVGTGPARLIAIWRRGAGSRTG